MLTFKDLKDRLKHLDEVTLLEVLNISSEDLVERFSDFIEDRFDQLHAELDDDSTEETD
jgi:hypothetical protein